MTIPEILHLFKGQLDNQINNIVKENSFLTQGYGFAYWYLRNVCGLTDIEAKENICDGGGDLGIDAVVIENDIVVFYQFKNPKTIEKSLETGEIDKLISGLELILSKRHTEISNPDLMERLEEIYSFTPAGYKICVAFSSVAEIPNDIKVKLDNFCQKNSGVARDLFKWEFSNLETIHNKFYTQNLPTLDATLDVALSKQPYMTKVGDHETTYLI